MRFYVVLVWAIISSCSAVYIYTDSQKIIKWTRHQLDEAKRDIIPIEQAAQEHLAWAKKIREQAEEDAKKIFAEAEKKTEYVNGIIRMNQQELHTVFPRLHKYQSGENEVNMGVFKSFSIVQHQGRMQIRLILENPSNTPITPRINLNLLNKYGFITDHANVYWLLHTIDPGERKIEYVSYTPLYGDPVYFSTHFVK